MAYVDPVGKTFLSGGENYTVVSTSVDFIEICFNKTISPSGLWRAENPLTTTLPVLILKLIGCMFTTGLAKIALKPLHQPPFLGEVLGGYLMSPQFRNLIFPKLFPASSTLTQETVASYALVYHLFLLGLEFDLKLVTRARKKVISVALVGVVFSAVIGGALFRYVLFQDFAQEIKGRNTANGLYFWGMALAGTNFVDVARILADLKLLYSDVGGLAMSASVISDLCSWVFILLMMAVFNNARFFTVGCTLVFVGLCVFVVRPALVRIIDRKTTTTSSNAHVADTNYDNLTCFVLAGVVLSALITDASGSHSIVGPFVLGAIIPPGDFKSVLKEKVANFVPGMLMPFYFVVTGGRINFLDILNMRGKIKGAAATGTTIYRVVAVVFIAMASKVATSFVVGVINKMSVRDSLTLGVLMNTKGILTLIIVNAGRDLKILNKQTFVIIVLAIWLMTFVIGPFLAFFYKSGAKPLVEYKQRNVRSVGPNSQLRIIACTHTSRNVLGIINLIDSSNPNQQSPIHVLALQLVELTGHASAMLVVHDTFRGDHAVNMADESSNAFEIYAHHRKGIVTVQKLTAVSAYDTMHEDITNLAEDNQVAVIIIPFHKQSSILNGSGAIEESKNTHLKILNNNLIASARCSVGILVDRGLGTSSNYSNCGHNFAMVFIGGMDDREALAYAGRMAGHPKVCLTVIHIKIQSKEVSAEIDSDEYDDQIILEAMASSGRQQKLDDLFMDEFRLSSMNDSSLKLSERSVKSMAQLLGIINSVVGEYDMFIVGRRHGSISELSTMMMDSNDTDELGVLGDALVSSTSASNTSVLVVQQGGNLDRD